VCYGRQLLYGRGHDVYPVAAACRQRHSAIQSRILEVASPSSKNRAEPHPLNVGSIFREMEHCFISTLLANEALEGP